MKLNAKNYYSKEADEYYMSNSQFKGFVGSLAQEGCEAGAMARLKGEWEQEPSQAMLIGSYVDSHFEGTLDDFRAENPQIFNKNGTLKAAFQQAESIIARIERDAYFMKFLSGEKQRIFTAEMFGVPWKCKTDSIITDLLITDLKIVRSIQDPIWTRNLGRTNFVRAWGYDTQMALYQSIVHAATGKKLPPYIAAASKEAETDIEIIGFDQKELDMIIGWVEDNIQRVIAVKSGKAVPRRCNRCDYCLRTKVLDKPLHFMELAN